MESLKGIFCGTVGVVGGIVANLLGGWDSGLATLFVCIVCMGHSQLGLRPPSGAVTRLESNLPPPRAGLWPA